MWPMKKTQKIHKKQPPQNQKSKKKTSTRNSLATSKKSHSPDCNHSHSDFSPLKFKTGRRNCSGKGMSGFS